SARYMVETFANMFHKLKYRVLYEGVETDEDEKLCLSMYAQYLQGFKYTEPIEIDRFSSYLKEVT
nr:EAL domain-containing protein [Lachnospiraceae bacterium]